MSLSYRNRKINCEGVILLKVCVIGLGSVGLPTALYIAGKNVSVVGYDISPTAINNAVSKGLEAYSDWEKIEKSDVYVICVSTLLNKDKPDFTALFETISKLKKRNLGRAIISIESTVTPGTCRKIYQDLGNQDLNVIHVPHRYWSKEPDKHGVRQQRVIGAVDEESMKNGLKFYGDVLDIPLHAVPSIEIAEMTKVLENAYRYLLIAFAEESRMICEGLGLDFEKVREACNTKWNTEILEAREGIGGHCLPKDIQYIISMSKHANLLKTAIDVDASYKKWISN